MFTKRKCKESQTPFTKKVEQRCWMILKLETFRPTLPFWTGVHKWRTNCARPFQRDCIAWTHACASQSRCKMSIFWYKIFLRKWPIVLLDKILIPQLWSCRSFYFGTMIFFSSNFFIFSHPTSPPSLSLIASVVPSSNRLFQNGFYFVE